MKIESAAIPDACGIPENDVAYVGWITFAFVVLQSSVFPDLGVWGALIVAFCATMPWVIPHMKRSPGETIALLGTTMILSIPLSMAAQGIAGAYFK